MKNEPPFLLKELFLNDAARLRESLQGLDAPQRQQLYGRWRRGLNRLQKRIGESAPTRDKPDQKVRRISLDELWKEAGPDPDAFFSKRWPKLEPFLLVESEARLLQGRLKLLQIGLGDERGATRGLKWRHPEPYPEGRDLYKAGWLEPFVLWAGRVLLDRPEPWVQDLFWKWCDQLERWVTVSPPVLGKRSGSLDGVAQLMREVLERFPQWRDNAARIYQKVMLEDEFRTPQWEAHHRTVGVGRFKPAEEGKKVVCWIEGELRPEFRKQFNADMVLAGLESEESLDFPGYPRKSPIQEYGCVLQRLARRGWLPLDRLVGLALDKLQSPLRATFLKGWLEFYSDLALTADEKLQFREPLLDLAGAGNGQVARIGLEVAEELWRAGHVDHTEVLGAVSGALQHRTAAVAGRAWKQLVAIAQKDGEYLGDVLALAIEAVDHPQRSLRRKVLKWLKRQREHLGDEQVAHLAELRLSLGPEERDLLEPLLQSDPTDTDKKTTLEASVDSAPAEETGAAGTEDHSGTGMPGPERAPGSSQSHPCAPQWQQALKSGHPTGQLGPLSPHSPTFTGTLEHNFRTFSSPAELAEALLEPVRTVYAPEEERLLDGLARFGDSGSDTGIQARLDPLRRHLEALGKLEQGIPDTYFGGGLDREAWYRSLPRGTTSNRLQRLLAYQAWIQPAKPLPPAAQQLVEHWTPVWNLSWRYRLQALGQARSEGRGVWLLGTPSHEQGWLDPLTLADRLEQKDPVELEFEELTAALYRLAPCPATRRVAWQRMAPSAQIDHPAGRALAVALGPDDDAVVALERMFDQLGENPPEGYLCYGGSVEPYGFYKTAPMVYERFSAPANRAFRLFCGALRARWGLGNAAAGIAELLGGPSRLDHLVELLQDRFRVWSGSDHKETITVTVLEELLWWPRPIRSDPVSPETLEHWSKLGLKSTYYHLQPYGALSGDPGFGEEYADAFQPGSLAFRHPLSAQRFFEAGLVRTDPTESSAHATGPKLLALGHQPQIDVSGGPGPVAALLACRSPRHREAAVELILTWLRDGRCTPAQLAEAVAIQLREVGTGFKNLEDALGSLGVSGDDGRLVALLAAETALSAGVAGLGARKLSRLLERLEALLEETGRSVADPKLRAELEALAGAKKKNAARERARRILARAPVTSSTEAALVRALLAT